MHYSVTGLSINNYLNGHSMLLAFKEWGAACISDILRQVSNEQYLDAIRMVEKFILHVEVLFGNLKGILHPHCIVWSLLTFGAQARLTFVKLVCFARNQSTCLRFCRAHKRQACGR